MGDIPIGNGWGAAPHGASRMQAAGGSQGPLSARCAPELVVEDAAGVLAGHKLGQAQGVVPRVGASAARDAHRLQPCTRQCMPSLHAR